MKMVVVAPVKSRNVVTEKYSEKCENSVMMVIVHRVMDALPAKKKQPPAVMAIIRNDVSVMMPTRRKK